MIFFIASIKAFSYGITPTRSGLLDTIKKTNVFSSNNSALRIKNDKIESELLNFFDEESQSK